MKTFVEYMSERDTTTDKIAAWIYRKLSGDKTSPLTKDEKIRTRNQLRSLNRMLNSEKMVVESMLTEMPATLASHVGTKIVPGKHSVEIATHLGKKLNVHSNDQSTQTLVVDHPTKPGMKHSIPYDKIHHVYS